jgi:hypothetical protein
MSVTVLVQILRCSIVVCRRVDEEASSQVRGLDGDIEGRIGRQLVAVLWARNDSRNHVVDGGDPAHGDAVAGTCRDLHSVGHLLAGAEIDKIGIVAAAFQHGQLALLLPLLTLYRYFKKKGRGRKHV